MERDFFPNPPPLNQLATSYLFCVGATGDQRTILARWCEKLQIQLADQVWFEEGVRLTIEMVRRFQQTMQLTPLTSLRRLGLIPGAHRLTGEASNALLKILEDAPPHAVFLLSVPDETMLLPTVVSRCQRWHHRTRRQENSAETGLSIRELQQLTYRERLVLAEGWAKETKPVAYLDQMIQDAHRQLTDGDDFRMIDQLVQYRSMLDTNVSPRLVLENCLLGLGKVD